MKTTSRLALVAAAGMLLGAAWAPANAADLGGGCCADLEERVAELEATTARKGNRVVSLQVYGQVNKALMIWDDGIDQDAFVVDNANSTSRIGFTGKATIKPGLTAGYLMEFDYADARSDQVHNGSNRPLASGKNGDDATTPTADFSIRQNNAYLESDRLGRITLGQGSTAADGANEVVLANSLSSSIVMAGNSFRIRRTDNNSTFFNRTVPTSKGADGNPITERRSLTLGNFASNLDAGRDDVIRYDTPAFYGLILSTSWGDNDYADVALRFKKEFNSVRVAAAVAYQWDGSEDVTNTVANQMTSNLMQGSAVSFETVSGSISAMHVPTGIYAAFAAGQQQYDGFTSYADDTPYGNGYKDSSFWYVQAGIEKKFLPYGTTTIYGEYGVYDDMAPVREKRWDWDNEKAVGSQESTQATRLGFGAVQKIDAAAMDIYAQATFWNFDYTDRDGDKVNLEDMSQVMVGSRIKF